MLGSTERRPAGDWFADQSGEQQEQVGELNRSLSSEQDGQGMIGQGANRDEAFKTQRSYESEYVQLAMQGGRKDLLCIDGQDQDRSTLRRNDHHAFNTPVKDNTPVAESEYIKLAKQGGQKNLLCIEENEKQTARVEYKSSSGDWYKHDQTLEASTNGHCNKITGKQFDAPMRAHQAPIVPTPEKQKSNNNSSGFFIGTPSSGSDQEVKFGKKRFTQNEKREAPFGTNF